MVSAASLITVGTPTISTTVNHNAGSLTFAFPVTNTGADATSVTFSSAMTGTATSSFSAPTTSVGAGATETITGTITFNPNQQGTLAGTIIAVGSDNTDSEPFGPVTINTSPSLSVSSSTITDTDTSASLTVKNEGNVDFSSVSLNLPDLTGATFTLSPTSISNLNAGQSQVIAIGVDTTSSLGIGANEATLTASANDGTTSTGKLTINRNFCKEGEQGTDLSISDVKIDNNDGDDEEWSPLDEVEIKVTVDNDGDERIKDVHVEIGLFDQTGKNVIKDMDDLDDEEIDLGSIKDGKDDTATFTFIIPADFEDDKYKLVVKAYSKDLKEENLCVSHSSDLSDGFFQEIDGQREEDEEKHIIFDNIKVSPSPAQCGELVQITGEIFNIGEDDHLDQVRVTMFNSDLKINDERIVRQDFDQGDSEVIDFELNIPSNAEEKIHVLEFRTYYDYDDGDDVYDIVSDDKFTASLRVEGNCGVSTEKDVQITAELDSETPQAVAGQQVVVNAILRNTGKEETTYAVGVNGISSWARQVSIEPQIITLSPGESKEASIALSVNNDVSGDQELSIKAAFDGVTKEQKVVLSVNSKAQPAQIGPVVDHLRNNWFIYLIILVNTILIIAIILVIRSMVSPSRPL
ncbi:hypothetical protein CMI42_04960 [Candidatus Pacearchaeota archaeon]|nr:hypothetical protein [Candidatus Pacearchaeota archaeon]